MERGAPRSDEIVPCSAPLAGEEGKRDRKKVFLPPSLYALIAVLVYYKYKDISFQEKRKFFLRKSPAVEVKEIKIWPKKAPAAAAVTLEEEEEKQKRRRRDQGMIA